MSRFANERMVQDTLREDAARRRSYVGDVSPAAAETARATDGCNEPPPSLDEMAALVRHACMEEAESADEHNVLRRLAERARTRYTVAQQAREMAERDLRDAYNEACKP